MGLHDVVSGVGDSVLWSHNSGQSVVSLRPALCSLCVSLFSPPHLAGPMDGGAGVGYFPSAVSGLC